MYKKVLAFLLAGAMVLPTALPVMAGESEAAAVESEITEAEADDSAATVGDDAEIKETLEGGLVEEVTDEDGSFETDKRVKLMLALFGPDEAQEPADDDWESDEDLLFFTQLNAAIDQHVAEENAEYLEAGDEAVISHTIAELDFHDEDDTLHVLGYFSITNYDKDKDCPDDLAMKNFAGQVEFLTLTPTDDGYEVTDCVAAEEGEGYADSVRTMCENINLDVDSFYETMALVDFNYLADLYMFMEEHPEYDHIEYMGEMLTPEDVDKALDEEFYAYLELYSIAEELSDSEADSVDSQALVEAILAEIGKSVSDVDLEKKTENLGSDFSDKGTVFSLLEDLLANINKEMGADGQEKPESLEQALDALASLDETEVDEQDDLLALALLALMPDEEVVEQDEDSEFKALEIASSIAKTALETAKENKLIKEAVEATGSNLLDMLSDEGDGRKALVKTDGTMDLTDDIPEEKFAELEEAFTKVTDYIKAKEGPKQAALDLLDLLHNIVDEIHSAVHGHTHELLEEQPSGEEADIDYAEVFRSWNPDSESLHELVAFVTDCTDETSEGYLAPADRIAVFDMDGTILCEKAPIYIDWCMTMYRVLDDPDFKATEEERAAMEQIREHAYTNGETFYPEGINKDVLVASAFAGMTPEEFRSYVVDFADNTDAVGFEGMTYGKSFYLPMVDVIDYLRDNDFDVWMVSACEREVVRALVDRFDIPFDHVIATDVPYVASGKEEDVPADDYNMSKEEEILLGTPLDPVECGKSGKPAAIAREIGKQPVLAFGNSSGDYSMLNYAESNPDHEGMGFFVVCDDTEREYGSDEKAADYYEVVEKEGWTAISMANDWATIYGEGVQKTELPGVAEEAAEAPAA